MRINIFEILFVHVRVCQFSGKTNNLDFFSPFCPKMDLGLTIQKNIVGIRTSILWFVYFVYLYFFLGVFQKHFLIILIIQKSDVAPLIFINDIVKNINDISEFSRLHFLLCKNTSCLKISYKKFVTPTLKCDIIVLLYIKAAK